MITDRIMLENDLWQVEISPAGKGRVVSLTDRVSGIARVQTPDPDPNVVAEGGHEPFSGLDCWTKYSNQPDLNTGVLSAFAPIHGQPFAVETGSDAVRLTARHAGLALTLEWLLPAGDAPFTCRTTLVNESAPADNFQFEYFFLWRVPAAAWTDTCAAFPGHAPLALQPFGNIFFEAGEGDGCAAWWSRGTADGVALRGIENVSRFFVGVHGDTFILGPHSEVRTLAPGESLTCAFEIAPLTWAQARGWACDTPAAETTLAAMEADAAKTAARVGSLGEWAKPREAAFARRAFHLTLQYAPSEPRAVLDILERIVAPAGYNQLQIEVDRAFPYRSHPQVAPAWAWNRQTWAEFLVAARSLGFELIPQYNALAHQGESALTRAYPEMAEDEKGWSLCPRHPNTVPYLLDLFDELIDAFEPRCVHIGLDEVDMPSRPQSFCVCPKCREADGGELFAEHIIRLHEHLAARGQEVMMWADMLLYREEHNCTNGARTGMWRAIDRLPRDIIMIDWVYSPVAAYGSTTYLLDKGFRVMGGLWHQPRAIAEFSRFAAQQGLYGMCQTSWASPSVRDWPMVCVLLAARYFGDPTLADDALVLAEARALAAALADGTAVKGTK